MHRVGGRNVEKQTLATLARMAKKGRKSPLGSHGGIPSPERRETANSSQFPTIGERLCMDSSSFASTLFVGDEEFDCSRVSGLCIVPCGTGP